MTIAAERPPVVIEADSRFVAAAFFANLIAGAFAIVTLSGAPDIGIVPAVAGFIQRAVARTLRAGDSHDEAPPSGLRLDPSLAGDASICGEFGAVSPATLFAVPPNAVSRGNSHTEECIWLSRP